MVSFQNGLNVKTGQLGAVHCMCTQRLASTSSSISSLSSFRFECPRDSPPSNLLTVCQVFFAVCASILVKRYAIYARHSGIPEIKTVLGGYVMKRFMGAWTLVIKSLGLVI